VLSFPPPNQRPATPADGSNISPGATIQSIARAACSQNVFGSDHTLALASYREALALAERVGDPQLLFPCYDGLATLYLDAGEGTKAELYLAKAQEVCERASMEPDALMVLPFLD
jgi:hypothetical protein